MISISYYILSDKADNFDIFYFIIDETKELFICFNSDSI